jgi:hypothetical protein
MSTKQETKYNKSAIVFITWILLANILLLVLNIVAISIQRSSTTDRFHEFVLQGERPIWTEEILEKNILEIKEAWKKLIADQNSLLSKDMYSKQDERTRVFLQIQRNILEQLNGLEQKIEKFHPEKQ